MSIKRRGKCKKIEKNVPRAILGSIISSPVLYMLIIAEQRCGGIMGTGGPVQDICDWPHCSSLPMAPNAGLNIGESMAPPCSRPPVRNLCQQNLEKQPTPVSCHYHSSVTLVIWIFESLATFSVVFPVFFQYILTKPALQTSQKNVPRKGLPSYSASQFWLLKRRNKNEIQDSIVTVGV